MFWRFWEKYNRWWLCLKIKQCIYFDVGFFGKYIYDSSKSACSIRSRLHRQNIILDYVLNYIYIGICVEFFFYLL